MAENRFASDDALAPEAATDEHASPVNPPHARDALDFTPVQLRHRDDGLTPAKQRDYVEALADTGLGSTAAARIGVSERSVARLRRRADAASFNLACAAARRFGARNIHDTAWERAIEGTIKGHYYHGELKSEERVFDNRLLIYLLGKTEHLLDEPPQAAAVAGKWEPFVEAMERGLPPPDLRSDWERERDEMRAARMPEDAGDDEEADDEDEDGDGEVWQEDDGVWMTTFPPPADFDGVEDMVFGMEGYRRTLSEAEEAALAAKEKQEEQDLAEEIRRGRERRDRYFGFEGGVDKWLLALTDEEDEDEDDEDDDDDEEEDEDEAGKGKAAAAEAPEGPEISSLMEAGLSGPSGRSDGAEEPGGQREEPEPQAAAPPAAAELYEPSWMGEYLRARGGSACTGSAQQQHSTEVGAGVTGRAHE